MASILKWLSNIISPNVAEAKIVGDKEAIEIISDIYNRASAGEQSGDYLSSIYKKIIKVANETPKTVSVNTAPGLADVYGYGGEHRSGKVYYDPKYSKEELSNIISHELFHFLNYINKEPASLEDQHSLMKSILGTDVNIPIEQLKGYKAPALSDSQRKLLLNILGE